MKEIKSQKKDADLDSAVTDLLSFKQISSMCDELIQKYDHLDFLINNGGAVFDVVRKLTEDGEERNFQLNAYSPFPLSHLLLPIIKKVNPGVQFLKDLLLIRVARQLYNLSKLYLI